MIATVIIALSSELAWKITGKDSSRTPSITQQQSSEPTTQPKIDDEALKNALNTYAKAKQEGSDLSNGPCLGIVAPNWVLDIAHNPRQPVDNKKENQCSEFIEGKVKHFIEFDPDGKLIRAF